MGSEGEARTARKAIRKVACPLFLSGVRLSHASVGEKGDTEIQHAAPSTE